MKDSLKEFRFWALFQYRKSAKVDCQEKKQTQDDVDVRPTCSQMTRSEIANTPCLQGFFPNYFKHRLSVVLRVISAWRLPMTFEELP